MYLPGFAYTKNEQTEIERRSKRYNEIKCFAPELKVSHERQYHKNRFEGYIPANSKLSEFDIGLLMDGGSVPFGGECTLDKDTGHFVCVINTD